jgi:phage-related protein
MVLNGAFTEYRDARFLKEFHDDPDKWEQLKSGEPNIANRLANEIKSTANSPRTKISSIPQMIRRSIERGETEFGDDDIEALQQAIDQITDQIHEGVRPFRIALKKMTRSLSEASMADVKALASDEISDFREALDYFDGLVAKHAKVA